MSDKWRLLYQKGVFKELKRLPQGILEIFDRLRLDFVNEGPFPKGWIIKKLSGRDDVFSVRLKREYRVLFQVQAPDIIVLKVSHRREVY